MWNTITDNSYVNDKNLKNRGLKCSIANRCCFILNPTASRYNLKINADGGTFCDTEGSVLGSYIMNQPLIGRPTSIGEFCFIGTGVSILSGTRLGKNTIVGANSVVVGKFPDNSIIAGNPAKIIRMRTFTK